MASDLEILKSLFGEQTQAEHADEQEAEDRRQALRDLFAELTQDKTQAEHADGDQKNPRMPRRAA